jgi:ubiquinone/menaquinone biosynthesis C-methylase UbiE
MKISKISPKSKVGWNHMADWWSQEAGDRGLYHQYTSIDPVVKKMIGPVRGKTVIEVGCGNGYFARYFAKRGADVTAIDATPRMIELSEAEESKHPMGIKFLKRDAARLSGVKSKSFDFALASMSLMDIKDAKGAIKELGRVLRPHGQFIFSIVHPAFLWDGTWETVEGKQRYGRIVWRYLHPYRHAGYWNDKKFKTIGWERPIQFYIEALRKAGFIVTDFREIPSQKPILKAEPGDLRSHRRISRYVTLVEKREKIRAQKEIPYFLAIAARKATL